MEFECVRFCQRTEPHLPVSGLQTVDAVVLARGDEDDVKLLFVPNNEFRKDLITVSIPNWNDGIYGEGDIMEVPLETLAPIWDEWEQNASLRWLVKNPKNQVIHQTDKCFLSSDGDSIFMRRKGMMSNSTEARISPYNVGLSLMVLLERRRSLQAVENEDLALPPSMDVLSTAALPVSLRILQKSLDD